MADSICCFRCGASLESLSLPLSRRDECPACEYSLHVCKMCVNYDATVPRQCREDDAEEVFDKEKVNFCEWFSPRADAFDPMRASEEARARSALSELFGEGSETSRTKDQATQKAEDIFK
jgi:hypothetical protein